jgi:hypothetical protein
MSSPQERFRIIQRGKQPLNEPFVAVRSIKMTKLALKLRPMLRPVGIFVALCIIYYCWMTGFTFTFSETSFFPTYNMLAESFLKGQLSIDENLPGDYLLYRGKKYLYFGPGPVLFHMPSLILGGRQTPTGLMVIIFLAGSAVVFYEILNLWRSPERALGLETAVFSVLFAFNGYSWLMAAIPSIHHEAICAGMFFLLSGMYFVLKSVKNGFEFSVGDAFIAGACFCLCLLSRFSYAITVIALTLTVIIGRLNNSKHTPNTRNLAPILVLAVVTLAGIIGTLEYNYLRFGSPADFGVGFMRGLYRDYFAQGNYFRYDHVPYNIWDYFFRIPQLTPDFPYLDLPFYVLEATSLGSANYFLMHVNELSVSIFAMTPVMLFCFFCGFRKEVSQPRFERIASGILLAAFALQVAPLSFTIGSIARYYFDFLPLMLLLAFCGYVRIKDRLSSNYLALGLTSIMSLVLSFCVPINALTLYSTFINFRSPLLGLW